MYVVLCELSTDVTERRDQVGGPDMIPLHQSGKPPLCFRHGRALHNIVSCAILLIPIIHSDL